MNFTPYFLWLTLIVSCHVSPDSQKVIRQVVQDTTAVHSKIITGAERPGVYVPMLKGKRVGMVVNQTSIIGKDHIIDSLIKLGVDIKVIMSPEHGFRGNADAGELISNSKDPKTGIPIISLYGKRKKPLPEDLSNLDVIVFDIQDVGARFYTYISTLHYVMEACAEQGKSMIILDRPNPNGHYVDGFVLDPAFKSFVGMHPVPVVHGMTIGEYATMINGEGWLSNKIKCEIEVVPCKEYTHQHFYDLPVPPSPNLPNMRAIYGYPFICFFEGTQMSLGRGTDKQFQLVGHPDVNGDFSFTPMPNIGAKDPPLKGQLCFGTDMSGDPIGKFRDMKSVDLNLLVSYYRQFKDKGKPYFLENNFIDKLAGTDRLRKMIEAGKTSREIQDSWKDEVEKFKTIRNKYLLYPQ